jgi:hypothetical protein
MPPQLSGISRIGREAAAEIDLPPGPPSTCSWVASTTRSPPGRMSTCALGLENRTPVIRSSTTPPRPRSARYQSGSSEARRRTASPPGSVAPEGGSSRTTLPSPAPLSSCLTTIAVTSGWADRIASAAATPSSTERTSSRSSGIGTPALAEQPAALALEAEVPQLSTRPVDRHVEREGEGDLCIGHIPRLDERRPGTDQASQCLEKIRAIEKLRGDREIDNGTPRSDEHEFYPGQSFGIAGPRRPT